MGTRPDAPWPFWKDKCYRTVKGIWKDIKLDRVGTHHNALHDAESQAEHLIAINRAAGGGIL
jgi:exodeoxyribonuclease VIII